MGEVVPSVVELPDGGPGEVQLTVASVAASSIVVVSTGAGWAARSRSIATASFARSLYNTVRRYVERSRPRPTARSSERFETAPGHQAQVHWSHEQPLRTSSGLELPLFCFHMVLGHSRDSFCALTGSQDLVTFWACHRAAFQHFGGVPREVLVHHPVLDRLKPQLAARAASDGRPCPGRSPWRSSRHATRLKRDVGPCRPCGEDRDGLER